MKTLYCIAKHWNIYEVVFITPEGVEATVNFVGDTQQELIDKINELEPSLGTIVRIKSIGVANYPKLVTVR